ncbi:DUF4394 domain-containing protein [Comamonas endophytica]
MVHVLDDALQLRSFPLSAPGTLSAPVKITGLAIGEDILGIDFYPGQTHLHALTSAGRLLLVDPATGVTAAAAILSAAATEASAPRLNGTDLGVGFNPAADCLRALGTLSHSLCIGVDMGDGTPGTAAAVATDIYDLCDGSSMENLRAMQAPPNHGTPLDPMDTAGGLVLAALRPGATGPFSLYTVSLATGAATLYGNASGDAARLQIGGAAGPVVRDIAIRH